MLTITTQGMPLVMFLRWISDESGVSVICEERIDNSLVVIDVKGQPVSEILSVVARRLGVQVTRTGDMYYIGQLRPEDRGVFVRKVRRLNREELDSALSVLMSDNGRKVVYNDGVCVIGDRVPVLQKIAELIDLVENTVPDSWVVQIYLVDLNSAFYSTYGLDVSASANLAYLLSASFKDFTQEGQSILKIILDADKSNEDMKLVAQPVFLLMDGDNSKYVSGEEIRIPKKTVSDQGTVTTSGYETIQTGIQVDVMIRDMGSEAARLTLKTQLSSVTGYSADLPVVSTNNYNTTAVIRSAGVYLLGGIKIEQKKQQASGVFSSWRDNQQTDRLLQIWARTYKIEGQYQNEP